VLANILNDEDVRNALADMDMRIPEQTRFVAAIHDTTTDEIHAFDNPALNAQVTQWLEQAGTLARRERAPSLGVADLNDETLHKAMQRRGRDWSQVRPEWGLADNASFIVAPRHRTRNIDLQGRAFLHDYDWEKDENFATLELIMTAPMLVTHWINMQYNASVTDNLKYGSGNKVLHNVVGGHIGVFEGNGGDLRIGLSMQSLHDGKQWMHHPLRLSVYIAAPRGDIEDIAERHAIVKNLIDNDWIYLYRLDDEGNAPARYYQSKWELVQAE
jgi:uncharacterized protein YbcC (UPF0753/DUF2309 family)